MPGIESLIQNSQKLTKAFGTWPSFHDADVMELRFWRDVKKLADSEDGDIWPELTAKIRVLQATQPNARGEGDDILVTLGFHAVCDVKMERFHTMNEIVDLSISTECVSPAGEPLPSYFAVRFESPCMMRASFRCVGIEVIDVIPYENV